MNTPLTDKNNILITSALPYINGIKHLGNLVGSMLPADLYARFMRLSGKNVMFICATDEHGTPAELAALAQSKPVDQYCTEMHDLQKILGEGFDLSWDYFGRSSSHQNKELTQYFSQRLTEKELIYEKITKQVYSIDDKRFLPDRYVEGTCPYCSYEKARGDQCESCTRVLDPIDLIAPYSSISGSKRIEIKDSNHLFLKQSALVPALREWIGQKKQENWSILVTSIAEKWLNEGLIDRSITRDLKWGIPVNREGFEDKVFYVWFDAPIAYIAATKEKADKLQQDDIEWQKWWKTDKGADDVFYVQFMAKDNIPFHTITFPATILGADDHWKNVDYIKGFHWLTYYGGKFSTSSQKGVFMNQALEIYPSDYWRWFLLSHAPENSDSAFDWDLFQISINKDLADVLGNFVSRITKFCSSKYGDSLPQGGTKTTLEEKYEALIAQHIQNYLSFMVNIDIRKSAQELRQIWVCGNEYLQEAVPWKVFKEDPQQTAMIIRFSFGLMSIYAELSKPFIPQISQKISNIINRDLSHIWTDKGFNFDIFEGGEKFTLPEIIISKVSDEDVEKYQNIYAGENH